MQQRKTSYSLKIRAYLFLFLSSLIPLTLIGYISYFSMYALLNNNIDSGIHSNIKQIQINLNHELDNLENAALQLAMYNGKVSDDIETYIETTDYLTKYYKKNAVIESISMINAAKSDIGLIFFYHANTNQVMFENQSVNGEFDFDKLPILATGINVTYYGPHITARSTHDSSVFSVARKVNLIQGEDLYVYMETGIKLFEDLLKSQQYKLTVSCILMNDQGKVMYSQNEEGFPVGSFIDVGMLDSTKKSHEINDDYYIFSEKGDRGWYILAAVDQDSYNYDLRKWIGKFVLFSLLSIVVSLFLGLSIWKIVYKRLKTINKEIHLLAQSKFNSEMKMTGILEFDVLLQQFYIMKDTVSDLFKELEEKERKKRVLEVEKLMHQINPHFLHNTLNTVQWLARMNGQDEIDRLVALFTRVLHYNLGKEGGVVSLADEVAVLQDYVDLQRIRYAYHFDVQIKVETGLEDVQVPRFIMQPIVENAIYHGLKDESGYIQIDVYPEGIFLIITVRDNGAGLSDQDISRLLGEQSSEHKKVGMGIGLSYVKHIIEVYYDGRATMEVVGKKGEGTTFKLRIPIIRAAHKEDAL